MHNSNANIRNMTIDDYNQVFALWDASSGVGLNDADDSQAGIARYLARNPHTCFVAEKDGRLVGAVLSGHDGRRGTIYHLAVAADQKRQGIGGTLVNAALDALRNEGIRKVKLLVFGDNIQAANFWESQEFTLRTDLDYRDRVIIGERRVYAKDSGC